MSGSDQTTASEVVSRLLVGTTLDSVRAYSIALCLCFERIEDYPDLPRQVSVWGTGRVLPVRSNGSTLNSNPSTASELSCADEFFKQRADVIRQLYLLIGSRVDSVCVDEESKLIILFSEIGISFGKDTDNLEEVWSVKDDLFDASAHRDWYVGLKDTNELVVRTKDN